MQTTPDARAAHIIECDSLVKIYKTPDVEVLALQGLDLTVDYGEMTAIIGNSGSGKSTFLNMLGGLDRPSAGRLLVDGKDLFKLGERELVEYKLHTVGFVWQNNARNLLPYLTATQNVMMPMLFGGEHKRRQRALELLDMVNMSHRKTAACPRCPAASSRESPSPSRWPTTRAFCWPTNPPAPSTRKPAAPSSICCAPSTASPA